MSANVTPVLAQSASSDGYQIVPPLTGDQKVVTTIPDIEGSGVPVESQATYEEAPSYTVKQVPAYTTAQSSELQPLQGRVATAPRGTNLEIVTNTTISSMTARLGDTFTATIEEPLIVDGQMVIPAGSEMIGQVTYIEQAGRIGKNATMDVRFTSVRLPNGEKVPINAKIITTDYSGVLRGGKNSNIVLKATGTTAATTATGAVAGTALGGIIGGVGSAAVFGTAVGGLVGIGYSIYRKGKNIVLPSGTRLGVTLEQPLTVSNANVEKNNYNY